MCVCVCVGMCGYVVVSTCKSERIFCKTVLAPDVLGLVATYARSVHVHDEHPPPSSTKAASVTEEPFIHSPFKILVSCLFQVLSRGRPRWVGVGRRGKLCVSGPHQHIKLMELGPIFIVD